MANNIDAQLNRIATQLDRIATSLGAITNFILTPKIQVMPRAPGGGGAGTVQPRGVETGVDASQAFLSGQWVRRAGDVWGPTLVGAKKRETP